MKPEKRTTDALLKMLDFDFFELLDSVTIARSRKHIEKYYNTAAIGKFPERLKPISLRPNLTDLNSAINYNEIFEQLGLLSLCVYTPSIYILPSKLAKYIDLEKVANMSMRGREFGIRRLMSINLLKRLESSVYSFRLTLGRILGIINSTIAIIDNFVAGGGGEIEMRDVSDNDFDAEDENTDFTRIGKKIKIDIADMDYVSW